MNAFAEKLRAAAPDPAGRRWLLVPYDQLSDQVGPLSQEKPREIGIVLVETRSPKQRAADARVFEGASETLADGKEVAA